VVIIKLGNKLGFRLWWYFQFCNHHYCRFNWTI